MEMENQQQQQTGQQRKKPQQSTTTTTSPVTEQIQQQAINTNRNNQQQHEEPMQPKVTVKTKGIVIADLKEFLANRRMDRAAWEVKGKNMLDTAERHTRPGFEIVDRAHRQRLEGISGRNEQEGRKTGSAKGSSCEIL